MITNLIIPSTEDTPEIILNSDGVCSFSGVSIPEDAHSFYQPVLEWLEAYKTDPSSDSIFNFHFQYLNQKTVRYLSKIFDVIENLDKEGNLVVVYWFFDDEDDEIESVGSRFEDEYNFPFIKSLFVI